MFNKVRKFYSFLNKSQRIGFLKIQVLVVLMAFAEISGVISIGPFMAVVGNKDKLEGDGMIAHLYSISGFTNSTDFLIALGVFVLIMLSLAAAISVITTWCFSIYAQEVGAEFSTRLYSYYINQPWLFHAGGSSSELVNRISQECDRVTNQLILPLMKMNAKSVLAVSMSIVIFAFNPFAAIIGIGFFSLTYLMLYFFARKQLKKHGASISKENSERLKMMSEGFGGVKDVLLLGRQSEFKLKYERASNKYAYSQGVNKALADIPKYIMEFVAFSSLIFFIMYLLFHYNGDLGKVLPLLSIYALAGFKLLPAFQQIYTSFARIKGNISAFNSLEGDLSDCNTRNNLDEPVAKNKKAFEKYISLENIFFRYPGKQSNALNNLNLTINKNEVVGFVGASGSGKSTAIDMLMGLIRPDSGMFSIDGDILEDKQIREWQNCIGFVPQSIFLSDASIRENIAFGLPLDKIDEDRVQAALVMAHLSDFIASLPDGLDTRTGERGVQLSGGQRQRIGIARSLYNNADVLVLDEATSALDGITEELVMDAIHDFSGEKTIIMIAHRLSTVKKCDKIFMFESGCVVDSGTYNELIVRNKIFSKMA